ncbi:MAG: hypothetical protein IJC67_00685 [Clostridia bacterium]|nr:hypothetical protein [Clostridia bacterium]
MKKLVVLLLALSMVLSLCACGAVELPVSEPEPAATPAYEMPKIVIERSETSEEQEETMYPAPVQEELVLTDDLFGFIFEIEGKMYQFPCLLSEFLEEGWEPAYNIDDNTVNGLSHTLVTFRNGEKTLGLLLYNGSGNKRPAMECTVGGITADNEEECAEVYMAGGLEANKITPDMALETFGEPTYNGHDGGKKYPRYYTYRLEEESSFDIYYRFYFDEETGDADYIWANCFTPIGGYDDTVVSDEYPELYLSYQEPTAMDHDPISGVVKFGGDYYRLPVPVKELEKNGWEIFETTEEAVVAGGSGYNCLTMKRGDEEILFTVYNFGDKMTYVENCCISSFKQDDFKSNNNVELIIPGGIKMGMSEKDLKKALPEEYNISNDLYSWYDWEHGIAISVFINEEGHVRSVEYEKTKWE